jgi:hypothetical protein
VRIRQAVDYSDGLIRVCLGEVKGCDFQQLQLAHPGRGVDISDELSKSVLGQLEVAS